MPSIPSGPAVPGYDARAAAAVISRALALPGGAELVVSALRNLPAVVRTPARKGLFRSNPEQIQIGSWRYHAAGDGRLHAAHIVNAIVLAEHPLPADAAGGQVAGAIAQHLTEHGLLILPEVEATLAGLATAANY